MHENTIYEYSQKHGIFEIDHLGRIWRLKARRGNASGAVLVDVERRRAEILQTNGYFHVRQTVKAREHLVALAHRLVYRAYFGEIPKGMKIIHLNGNKQDNRPENIKAVMSCENVLHREDRLGLSVRGEDHGQAKLTSVQVMEIRRRFAADGVSKSSLAREYGVSPRNIRAIITRQSWRHI